MKFKVISYNEYSKIAVVEKNGELIQMNIKSRNLIKDGFFDDTSVNSLLETNKNDYLGNEFNISNEIDENISSYRKRNKN